MTSFETLAKLQVAMLLPQDIMDEVSRHALEALPDECCGLLVGQRVNATIIVERSIRATNIAEGDRRRNYQIDWQTLFDALRSLRDCPNAIVGFYHSHPNGQDTPSASDRAPAWLDHAYVIVPIKNWKAGRMAAWIVHEEGVPFTPMSIRNYYAV